MLIVVDTTVFVSAILGPRGPSRSVVRACLEGRLQPLMGASLNKLFDELATIALAEFDAFTRFRARAAAGSREEGLRLLDKLDADASP